MAAKSTYGPVFVEKTNGQRIHRQMDRIREFMLDAGWRTLAEISEVTGYPEASISAQLRHLRKAKFDCYQVDKRRRILSGTNRKGTWEYFVRPASEKPIKETLF